MKNKKVLIITAIVLIVCIISAVVFASSSAVSSTSAAKLLDLGNKYLLEENYEEAILAFNKAIEIEPKNIDARLGLVEVYRQTGELDKEEILLKEIRDIEPSSIDTIILLADLFVKQGKETEARTLLEDAIAITSDQQSIDKLQALLNTLIVKRSDELENTEVQSDNNSSLLLQSVQIGDTITFGQYEQDNNTANGKEDIAWTVLAVENGKALLISEKSLDHKPFNEVDEKMTWETCYLREWLNTTFVQVAFNTEEESMLAELIFENKDKTNSRAAGGNQKFDKVFLLSTEEAKLYFADDEARITFPTPYAIAQGVNTNDLGSTWWGLRLSDDDVIWMAFVDDSGGVCQIGSDVYNVYISVRPALWLNLPS